MKNPHVRISTNAAEELKRLIETGTPAATSDRGDLFIAEHLPMAVIRLKVGADDYIGFLATQSEDTRLDPSKLVTVEAMPECIVINGTVTIEHGQTLVAGKRTVIL